MKINVAILEDNALLLKDLKEMIEATQLANVLTWSKSSEDFIEKVKSNPIDALLLDIDLQGDSMNGIDVANTLNKPVLFVSGKTGEFYKNIEEVNLESDTVIEHISKPITISKLQKILPKFIQMISASEASKFVFLDFEKSKRNKIAIDSIVYLATGTGSDGLSNKKEIFFTDRKMERLIDFSFTKMEFYGLESSTFIQISRSHRVNKNKIIRYITNSHTVEVSTFENKIEKLSVSENYRKLVRQYR